MGIGYIPFLLQLVASALAELIPSNVPFIGAAEGGGYRGGREPLTFSQTFWAVFWAIIAASVVVSIGSLILFFILFGIFVAALEDAF